MPNPNPLDPVAVGDEFTYDGDTWEVDAEMGDGLWQAELIHAEDPSDPDDPEDPEARIGRQDVFVEHVIQFHRTFHFTDNEEDS